MHNVINFTARNVVKQRHDHSLLLPNHGRNSPREGLDMMPNLSKDTASMWEMRRELTLGSDDLVPWVDALEAILTAPDGEGGQLGDAALPEGGHKNFWWQAILLAQVLMAEDAGRQLGMQQKLSPMTAELVNNLMDRPGISERQYEDDLGPAWTRWVAAQQSSPAHLQNAKAIMIAAECQVPGHDMAMEIGHPEVMATLLALQALTAPVRKRFQESAGSECLVIAIH